MATKVGSLYSSITLESASFISNAKRSADATEQMAAQMDKAFGIAKAAAVGFAASFSIDKIIDITKAGLEYASGIAETAQQLGVGTKALQIYGYAATQVGIEQSDLEKGLGKLTVTLGKAKDGSKASVAAFTGIGISIGEFTKLNPDEALRRVSDALAKIKDPATRAAAEVALFGKSGQKLDNLLAGGTAAIDEMATTAEKLGLVLSDTQIQNADRTADKIKELQTALAANISGVVADNASAIYDLATAFEAASRAAFKGVTAVGDYYRGLQQIKNDAGGGVTGFAKRAGALLFRSSADISAVGKNARELEERQDFTFKLGHPDNANQGNYDAGDGGVAATAAKLAAAAAKRAAAEAERTAKAEAKRIATIYKEIDALIAAPLEKSDRFTSSLTDAADEMAQLDGSAKTMSQTLDKAFSTDNVDQLIQKIPDLAAELEKARAVGDKFGEDLSRNLGQAIVYGQSLGDALINSIKAAAAELITSGLLNLLKGSGGSGGLLTSIGKFATSVFGGARAEGGPVSAGSAYLVGERGPEILSGVSGHITSNTDVQRMMGGGGRQAVDVSVNVAPSPLFITAVASVSAEAGQRAAGEQQRKMARPRLSGGRG